MNLPALVIQETGDVDARRAQEAVQLVFRQLSTAVPMLDGGLLASEGLPVAEGLAFAAGVTRDIAHKLGRKARGVIVVDTLAGTPSLPLRDPAASTALFIRLTFATACRVKLWVW